MNRPANNLDFWHPLPGVTRLDFNCWPLARPSRWTWRDTVLVLPMGLALVLVGLPVVAFVGWRKRCSNGQRA